MAFHEPIDFRRIAGAVSTTLSYLAVGGVLAAQLVIATPVQATSFDISRCSAAGGVWRDGRCDHSKNNDFDLFSVLILGALGMTALGLFENDRHDRPQGRQAPPPHQRR